MRILASLRLLYKYQAYHSDAIKGMFLTDNVEDIVEFLGSKVFYNSSHFKRTTNKFS